jgi:hypothetical protein
MCGFAAKFQQDSLFIIYNLSDSPVNHKTVSYVSDWGSSSNDKAYRYNNKTEDDEVDYSDYSYKMKLRKSDRSEPKYIENGYDVVGELWERDQKFKEPEDLINEVVTRNEYDMERLKAVILLFINSIVWIATFILSIPFALFFWLKRIFIKTK